MLTKRIWVLVFFLLALCACMFLVWRDVYTHGRGVLRISFLDVGQGDSIYIESPTGVQVVVDAGATRQVLRSLRAVMPLFDRSLAMIVVTHPDEDHIGGFADVLPLYAVEDVVYRHVPGVNTPAVNAFEQALIRRKLTSPPRRDVIEPHRGDVYDIGGGAYILVFAPAYDADAEDTNSGSVVAQVVYGETTFLLTGDAPQEVEHMLVFQDEKRLASNVLKVGHHGSRTSSSAVFLAAVHPDYAIVSRGCENTYGHPHKEVLALLEGMNIPVLDTCKVGTITFTSDGRDVVRE